MLNANNILVFGALILSSCPPIVWAAQQQCADIGESHNKNKFACQPAAEERVLRRVCARSLSYPTTTRLLTCMRTQPTTTHKHN
jgi:hypothetical protein